MRKREPYTSAEGAEAEAAKRFGAEWARLVRLLPEIEAVARLDETAAGLSRVAEVGAALKRAIPSVRQAQRLAARGVAAFDRLGDVWPPEGIEDLPETLASILEQMRRAEATCRLAARSLPRRHGTKLALVSAALKYGVALPAKNAGAAWALAFIALDLAEPIAPSRAPGANRHAWQLRLIEANKVLAAARRRAG